MAFHNSYLALQEYDRTMEERAKAWCSARTVDELRLAEVKDQIATQKVQHAFVEDAKAMNHLPENFRCVSIMFIRDCVRRFHDYEGPIPYANEESKLRQGNGLAG